MTADPATAEWSAALAAVRNVHDGDLTRQVESARRWAVTCEQEAAELRRRVDTARAFVEALVCWCRPHSFVAGRVVCDRCQALAILAGDAP